MNWILVTIFVYFLFAIVFLIDKYILVDFVIDPKIYTFCVSLLGMFVLIFIPFIDFYLPDQEHLFFALFSGIMFVPALFFFNILLLKFEASRVVPAIGGMIPIFIFVLSNVLSPEMARLDYAQIISLFILVAGSVLISYKPSKGSKIDSKMLKMILICSFLFALSSLFSKYAYIDQKFLVMLVWMKVGGFLASLLFLLEKNTRDKIFKDAQNVFPQKAKGLFIANQAMGASGNILFNWVIFIVPIGFVAIVNALQGLQNIFLFVFALFFSKKFPKIFQENLSRNVLIQKFISIILIGSGLVILAFK
ncbi:MAG: hypothetical protein ABH967_02385 [Patescibacteria group bacterium]